MKIRILVILCLSWVSISLVGQSMSAIELIKKSQSVHDPKDKWKDFTANLNIAQTRPDGTKSQRQIYINNKKNHFKFSGKYPEGLLQYAVDKKGARYSWNGKREVPNDVKEKYKINDDRAKMYHNYYAYMYGMPMKLLSDPGTLISPTVEEVTFKDDQYWRVKVTYDPEVGDDIWYFYFNPQSYELELYQFFHDESINDGEYILLEGWKYFGELRLPEKLLWYYNKDDVFLGEDRLVK